jgi:hypothetical protein
LTPISIRTVRGYFEIPSMCSQLKSFSRLC